MAEPNPDSSNIFEYLGAREAFDENAEAGNLIHRILTEPGFTTADAVKVIASKYNVDHTDPELMGAIATAFVIGAAAVRSRIL